MSFGNNNGFGSKSAFGTQPTSFGTQPSSFGGQTSSFGTRPSSFGSQPQVSSMSGEAKGFFNSTDTGFKVNSDPMMTDIEVTKVYFAPQGRFNNQVYRPFEARFNRNALNMFDSTTEGGRLLDKVTMSKLATSVLDLSSQSSANCSIDNGWGENRYSVLIRVVVKHGIGNNVAHLLMGYTDHLGITIGMGNKASIDPNMRIYINRVFKQSIHEVQNQFGRGLATSITEANNLLTPNSQFGSPQLHLMRPQDVVSAALTSKSHELQNLGGFGEANTVHLSALLNAPKMSRLSNSSPAAFLSKTLGEIKKASIVAHSANGINDDPMEDAIGSLTDNQPLHNAFLRFLRNETNWNDQGFFTWGELLTICPEVNRDDITSVASVSPNAMSRKNYTEYTSGVDGRGYEDIISARVAQELPSMLLDCGLAAVMFTVTNEAYAGQVKPELIIEGVSFLSDTMTPQQQQDFLVKFRDMFTSLAFMPSSNNNETGLTMKIEYRLGGDAVIKMRYNGGVEETRAYPTFAESNFTSVLTPDPTSFNTLATSITKFTEIIENGFGNNNSAFSSIRY